MADILAIEWVDVQLVQTTKGVGIASTTLSSTEVLATTFMTGLTGAQGVGLPKGGKAGQVLVKQSDADYDFKWVDSPQGNANNLLLTDSALVSWLIGITTNGNLTTTTTTASVTNTYGGTYGNTVYA